MRIRKDLVLRQLGDDYVVVDSCKGIMDFSKVYTLNETATFLWKNLIDKEFDFVDVVDLMLEKYDVDREQAEIDAKKIMQDFEKINNAEH